MSNVAINPAAPAAPDHPPDSGHGIHAHDPHLAHHFDTPEQQYASAKLGMWIFLGTEILMFGGLFCGYSVYRHNHPEVFAFAHQFLDKWLGALNTLVLITSSLTMAWAVRSSQLGHQPSLRWLMALTILGGYIFLGVKSIEYNQKWHHALFIGPHNQFLSYTNNEKRTGEKYSGPTPVINEENAAAKELVEAEAARNKSLPAPNAQAISPATDHLNYAPVDPNQSDKTNAAAIHPTFPSNQSLAPQAIPTTHDEVALDELNAGDKERIYTFFAVYFVMTGLHGLHVVIGMSLIAWVLLRALGPKNIAWAVPLIPASIGVFLAVVGLIIKEDVGNKLMIVGLIIAMLSVLWAVVWVPRRRNRSGEGEFGPTYFTPVDLVGLYWHLVDLIWIFLFPLLYLIH